MHERPRDTSLPIIGVIAVGFSHDAQSLSQGHEEKMFIWEFANGIRDAGELVVTAVSLQGTVESQSVGETLGLRRF
jgi:hypothetical protein